MNFERGYVAFLDILGWRELVAQAAEDREAESLLIAAVSDVHQVTLQRLKAPIDQSSAQKVVLELAESSETTTEKDVDLLRSSIPTQATVGDILKAEFTQFSDCMVFSSRGSLFGLLIEIAAICRGYLFHGLLVRGGIAFGSFFHRESVALGPALTEAYRIESEVAQYPRIVLHPSWTNYDLPWAPLMDDDWNASEQLSRFKLLARAPEGCVFVNYLHPLVPPMHAPNREQDGPGMFLKPARPVIKAGLEKYSGNPRIFEKYRWLAEYFNDILLRVKAPGIEALRW